MLPERGMLPPVLEGVFGEPLQHRVGWLRVVRRTALDRLGLQRVSLRRGRDILSRSRS